MVHSGEFLGTNRFFLRRKIGSGAMGVVYEVFDHERGDVVALKSLHWADPAAIYRLKQEFRALADVAHPNLVSLYELVANEHEWFFTMELVHGVDFLRYVRPDTGSEASPLDAGRLRAALAQLAAGVHHLHRAGKLHRDLKPPNVLVTRDHRVVILDFGIASDTRRESLQRTLADGIAGTALYMAPEQINGETSVASDWYAVGSMLYEALTGRAPFNGPLVRVLRDKTERDVESPAKLVPGLPEDLVTLCCELLDRDVQARPNGEALLARLGLRREASPMVAGSDGAPAPLIGRDESLAQLVRALDQVQDGRPASIYVYGPSGIGKSALVRHFIEDVVPRANGLVFSGRCYERESVPHKALDGVVDSLTRYLRRLPPEDVEPLVPPEAATLARVFPVLSRVDAIASAPHAEREIPDPRELRRRAFATLRELLVRLSVRQPLVLYVDDLHWADAESIALLDGLLLEPGAPRLLLIACFRSEELASNPALREMLARIDMPGHYALSLGPLSESHSHVLARNLLSSLGGAQAGAAEAIVREAAGVPFLAEQLAQYVSLRGIGEERVTFEQMLTQRLESLPEEARRALHVLAVAGRPLASTVVRDAAALPGDERPVVGLLAAERLIRATGSPARLEFYHDRLREALSGNVNPVDARRTHLVIARLLEREGADSDVLFDQYARAGESERAHHYAVLAAQKASAALAFDQAVGYYERALELAAPDADVHALQRDLGDALSSAGRGERAARTYLEAARLAPPAEALDLRRRAAEQFLISGHLDEGLAVMRTVLASVGLRLAATPRRALASLLLRRLQLRVRGGRYTERAAQSVSADDLMRIDTCWSVYVGLTFVDNIRAAEFQARHVLLALEAGEPHRVARALAIEASILSTTGGTRARTQAGRRLSAAQTLAERLRSPYALALCQTMSASASYFWGEWRTAYEESSRAVRTLTEDCAGVAWELTTARTWQVYALFYLGDFREMTRLAREYLRDAIERGNVWAATALRLGQPNAIWLAADDPLESRRMIDDAMMAWPQREFHIPHYLAMLAEGQRALYTGDPRGARATVEKAWTGFRRSLLPRVRLLRIAGLYLRARANLAVGAIDAGAASVAEIERDISVIERERMPWSDATAILLRAGVAALEGDRDAAVRLLSEAETRFAAVEMSVYAAAARRQRGELLSGAEGRALAASADDTMRERGVVNPGRMTAMLAAGFGA